MRRQNLDANREFFSRDASSDETVLHAKIQAIATLRIVQEYVAGMETAGALLRAIHGRTSLGGIMRANHRSEARDVRAFLLDVLAEKRMTVHRLLAWPSLSELTGADAEMRERARRLYPWLRQRIRELAKLYVGGKPFRLTRLERPSRGRDPRRYAYIFVYVLNHGEARPQRQASVIVQGLNKLKHGFNATANLEEYRVRRGARGGVVAMVIPRAWPAINHLGQQSDLLSVMCREIARFTLDCDTAGLL